MAGKVARVTLAFWIIKIVATTLGETGGDALSMPPINLGYDIATAIFLAFFVVTVIAQVAAKKYHPALYWSVIVATTTLGTTVADKLTREVLGTEENAAYGLAALALFVGLVIVLIGWHFATGSISINKITTKKSEVFYWLAILVSNTLGTALGDWLADTSGFGFERGALVFGGAIAVIGGFYLFTKLSRPILFWSAFILTRPLGATVGDLITKPFKDGGLNLSRPGASVVILLAMIPLIAFWARKPEAPEDFEA
ncbi:MAG: hypothetical protein BGO01_12945 [Armatimonadetes bacterium 55-13]|nr:hypothetical protein [Armatimonadota bacterium]ODU52640.1 MAG: hypothetical protein ABT09_02555 [bacterium SCN 57-13]OJU61816.1 MAG: hypothetical protein BGO01_12945 [Armatimonadetes bacterium 55-13]